MPRSIQWTRALASPPTNRSAPVMISDPDPVGSGAPALGGRVVHDLADRVMHDDDCLAGADHLGGEDRPVEYQVR